MNRELEICCYLCRTSYSLGSSPKRLEHGIENKQALRSHICIEFDHHIGASCELDNIKHRNPKAETYRELSSNRTQSQFSSFQIMPLMGLHWASQYPGGLRGAQWGPRGPHGYSTLGAQKDPWPLWPGQAHVGRWALPLFMTN